jgi:hypothetical protein
VGYSFPEAHTQWEKAHREQLQGSLVVHKPCVIEPAFPRRAVCRIGNKNLKKDLMRERREVQGMTNNLIYVPEVVIYSKPANATHFHSASEQGHVELE